MAEPLEIIVQGTPNPNAAKFTLNRVVTDQGATFRLPAPRPGDSTAARQAGDPATASAAWARELLGIPGITQVFAVNNFVSVTKDPGAEWERIAPEVERVLRQAFA